MVAADLYPDYRAGKDRLRRIAQGAMADGERIIAGTHPDFDMSHAEAFFFFQPCLMGRNLDSLILSVNNDTVSPVLAMSGMPYAPPLLFGPPCEGIPAASDAAHNMMSLAYAMVLRNRIEMDMVPVSRIRFRSGAWIELPDHEIEAMSRKFPKLSLSEAAGKIDNVRARVAQATGKNDGQIDGGHPNWKDLKAIAAFALYFHIGPVI